jgi:hypothetical protein
VWALYAMTRTDAISKIRVSLIDSPQVITPKNSTYKSYVKQQSNALIEAAIEPTKAKVGSACFPEYYLEKYQKSTVWAIARSDNNWLLTLENEQEFALAFGNSTTNLMMLGFSSSDALAEWLG